MLRTLSDEPTPARTPSGASPTNRALSEASGRAEHDGGALADERRRRRLPLRPRSPPIPPPPSPKRRKRSPPRRRRRSPLRRRRKKRRRRMMRKRRLLILRRRSRRVRFPSPKRALLCVLNSARCWPGRIDIKGGRLTDDRVQERPSVRAREAPLRPLRRARRAAGERGRCQGGLR